MLTQSLRKKIVSNLSHIDSAEGHFNLNQLQGYLHAVVITPDIIPPSEWLPKIFNDQMPEFESIEQTESVMGSLMECYNHYNTLKLNGGLSYSYDVKKLNPEMFDDIMDWGWGFLTGLRLRMNIWMARVIAEELGEAEDPVANSVAVVLALVDKNFDTLPMIRKIKNSYDGEITEEELEPRFIADLITVLPESVKVLQNFGEHMDERRQNEVVETRPARTKKIGRNEPCPCGSGKKYKKCCGLTGADGYLH